MAAQRHKYCATWWQLTPQPGSVIVPPIQGSFLSQLLSSKVYHRQDLIHSNSSRTCYGVEHAQDPGCGDLPGPPTTERLFLLHAALQAGMPIG